MSDRGQGAESSENRRRQWLAVGLMFVCLAVGCGSSEVTMEQAGKTHGHEHAHDHSHDRPRHKPRSFDAIPGALLRRLPADGDASKLSRRRVKELQEIAGWIPELAADSELKREGFERAVECQAELEGVLAEIASGRQVDMRKWSEAVDRLGKLAESQERAESGVRQE